MHGTASQSGEATTAPATMTAEERYLFDLQGYLVVPNALDATELAALNAIMDQRIAAEVAADARSHRFLDGGSRLAWGAPYRALLDHPKVRRFVDELTGPTPRLDHDYADIIRSGVSPIGATLHGGATPFDPCMFYTHSEGRSRCGLMVVAWNLHDVNPGDGGFGAVPGSHKAHFPYPEQWLDLERPQPFIVPVTGKAGTAIIFSEAMTHGALPWRGRHERRTLFYKYSPGPISWAADYYDPDAYPDLTPRQRALLEAPNARYDDRPAPAAMARRGRDR